MFLRIKRGGFCLLQKCFKVFPYEYSVPPFTKPPNIDFDWNVNEEIKAIQKLQNEGKYKIPKGRGKKLLCVTWNIANFDAQKRSDKAFPLIAKILKPFDLVAIQEINSDLSALKKLMKLLSNHSIIFTDIAGNEERMCYIYKKKEYAKLLMLEN